MRIVVIVGGFMENNTKLQMENIILKVENLMQKNIILEMKLEKHIEKYKKYLKNKST